MSVHDIKAVAVGDSQVGKTSVFIARTSQVCSKWYHPNIFDTYLVHVPCGSTDIDLEVWDTSGTDCDFSAFPNTHNGANVYLLFFALNSTTSYQNVKTKWYPEIQRFAPEVPIVLIGTKCDTRKESIESFDMVTSEMGQQLKEEIGACSYVECSAKRKLCLVEVFDAAARYASPPHRSSSPAEAPCEQPKVLRSWLGGYADQYLYQEARCCGAEKKHMTSRLSTTLYLDSLRSDTFKIRSPPAWAMTGTEIDRHVCGEAFVRGARALTLLRKDETHNFLDAKRAAGVKIDAPPSWVTDSSTLARFKEAVRRNIPPHKLNSRAETDLFLLNIPNIEDDKLSVPSWSCCMF